GWGCPKLQCSSNIGGLQGLNLACLLTNWTGRKLGGFWRSSGCLGAIVCAYNANVLCATSIRACFSHKNTHWEERRKLNLPTGGRKQLDARARNAYNKDCRQ